MKIFTDLIVFIVSYHLQIKFQVIIILKFAETKKTMSSDSTSGMLKPGQVIKALIDKDSVSRLVELRYGLVVKSIVELDAYDDRNFRVICEDRMPFGNPYISHVAKHGYIVKVINSLDSQNTGLIEAQNELLCFLSKKGFKCPCPVKQKDGSYYWVEKIENSGEGKNDWLIIKSWHL